MERDCAGGVDQSLEHRVRSLESAQKDFDRISKVSSPIDGEPRGAEGVGRLRNELTLGVQELNQQLEDQSRGLQKWQDHLETEFRQRLGEAQQTYSRLADNTLGVAE